MITRADFEVIASWVKPGARVLDLGCGDGALLAYLRDTRNVQGYGNENDETNDGSVVVVVATCISSSSSVFFSFLFFSLRFPI